MSSENILYSFRRCPYAIRARWAILKNKVLVTIREVDLKDKPPELSELSSKGTVPVLYTSQGYVIDESLDIIKWSIYNSNINVDNIGTNLKVNSKEASDLLKVNDIKFKYHLDRFKYSSRYKNNNPKFHQEKALKIIDSWNKNIEISISKGYKGWLLEDSESIADWGIWPFVRQYLIADPNLFERNTNLIYIKNWLLNYTNDSSYKILMKKFEKWRNQDKPIYFYS